MVGGPRSRAAPLSGCVEGLRSAVTCRGAGAPLVLSVAGRPVWLSIFARLYHLLLEYVKVYFFG